MKTLYESFIRSPILHTIINFKAIEDSDGDIYIYAETNGFKGLIGGGNFLNYEIFYSFCMDFANTFKLNQ